MHLLDVAKSFEDQEIHPAFEQSRNLVPKGSPGFVKRCLAQRLNADSKRTYRACNPGVEALCGLFGQAGTMKIDFPNFIGEPMMGKSNVVSPKRIGLNHLCARLQIFVVNAPNQVRLGDIKFVIAAIDEY